MADSKGLVQKFDPNQEIVQCRAQWKKAENCRKEWQERWGWLLDERKRAKEEDEAIRKETADVLPHFVSKLDTGKNLKPVPVTTTGFIGWLAAKPECQLEIYTSWLTKVPVRLPDAWDYKDYEGLKGLNK